MIGDLTLPLKSPAKTRPTPAERGLRSRVPPLTALSTAALPVAVLLWLVSLQHVALGRMGDFGLIGVLPMTYWLALALLTVGFVLTLMRPRISGAWLAAHVVTLLAVLHATPTLLYGTLRYSWAWKHIAVVDYLLRHNATDTSNGDLGAYHQWPGFFTLNALLVRAAGLSSSTTYAAWAPLINNLLLIGPLVLLYRSMTSDRRLVWTGVWVFFSCAWVGQDYFSPQAFALVLYLTVIALVLYRLSRAGPGPVAGMSREALTWFVLLVPAIATILSSHQLTPLILISTLGILSLSRRRWRTTLPLLVAAAAFTVFWWATVAWPFIQANLHSILKSFGSLDSNVGSPLAGQAATSPQQQRISNVETGLAFILGLVALIAVLKWRDLRRGPALLLAVSPIPLLAVNDYGGEMIFRAYLFALPGTAFLTAAVIHRISRRIRVRAVVSLAAFTGLLGIFVLGYFGKERENYFSPAEVAASRYMYSIAPHGSMIVAATSEYPGAYTDYEDYSRVSWLGGLTAAQRAAVDSDPAGALAAVMRDSHGRPAYFILTKSQEAEVEMAGLLPAATLARVERIPGNTPEFSVVYRNADAVVMVLAPSPNSVSATGE